VWLPTTTTLMIRNISLALSKENFIRVLETQGFKGKFDFISVPRRTGRVNLGYAFVNFCSPDWARLCHQRCHGQPFGGTGGGRNCEVLPAHRQRHASAQNSSQNSQAGRSVDSPDAAYEEPGQASRHYPGTGSTPLVQPVVDAGPFSPSLSPSAEQEEAGRRPSGHGAASFHGHAGAQNGSQSNGCPAGRSGSFTDTIDTTYEASPYLTSRQSPSSATSWSSLPEAGGRRPSAHGAMSFHGVPAPWTTSLAPPPPSRSGTSNGLRGLAVAQVGVPFFI